MSTSVGSVPVDAVIVVVPAANADVRAQVAGIVEEVFVREGAAVAAGQPIARLSDRDALARLRGTRIGFVFQAHHLLPQCTVLENVLVPTLAEVSWSMAVLPDARQSSREGAETQRSAKGGAWSFF